MPYQHNTQREVWNEFHADTPEGLAIRQHLSVRFRRRFPAGHRTSIRPFIEAQFAKLKEGVTLPPLLEDLGNIHPVARQIILEHGKDYRPMSFKRSTPHEGPQPKPQRCFENAAMMMPSGNFIRPQHMRRFTYVEGVVIGLNWEAFLHAWNGIGFAGETFDWSLYAQTDWTKYFGVPFTEGEYSFIINNAKSNPGCFHTFFLKSNFENIQEPLMEVLKRPRTRLCKRNGSWEWTETFQPA